MSPSAREEAVSSCALFHEAEGNVKETTSPLFTAASNKSCVAGFNNAEITTWQKYCVSKTASVRKLYPHCDANDHVIGKHFQPNNDNQGLTSMHDIEFAPRRCLNITFDNDAAYPFLSDFYNSSFWNVLHDIIQT